MNQLLRKLVGIAGLGLVFSVSWVGVFSLIISVIGYLDPDSIDPGESWSIMLGIGAAVGFVSGLGFAILLAWFERGNPTHEIHLGRAACWGILGSTIFPLISSHEDQVLVMCPIGAVVAMIVVALARRGEPRDPAQPTRATQLPFRFLRALVRNTVAPLKGPFHRVRSPRQVLGSIGLARNAISQIEPS